MISSLFTCRHIGSSFAWDKTFFGLCGRSVRSFWFPVSRPDACRFRIFVVSISLWYHERYHTRTCYEKTRRWFADIMLEVKPVRRLSVASSCLSPLVVTSDAQVESSSYA